MGAKGVSISVRNYWGRGDDIITPVLFLNVLPSALFKGFCLHWWARWARRRRWCFSSFGCHYDGGVLATSTLPEYIHLFPLPKNTYNGPIGFLFYLFKLMKTEFN